MIPPKPKPTMVSVYGNEAAPRSTPKSACTAGSATTTDHMPMPPSVAMASVTASRHHAVRLSMTLEGAGEVGNEVSADESGRRERAAYPPLVAFDVMRAIKKDHQRKQPAARAVRSRFRPRSRRRRQDRACVNRERSALLSPPRWAGS